ncbi:FluC/FEX family fluoride channel [Wenzhouxiangella sp. EGI_FJ10409]|uniref:FluC/FEX family fluoride channel n=1 Tax=Wenzhouxiangella sp. EGI_FJ10409 TaxID=3243767 RepID=UPI0035D710D0
MRSSVGMGVYLAVALGGLAGGLLRMLVLVVWPAAPGQLPLGLLMVNAGGAGLIGVVLAFSESGGRHRLPPALSLGLMAGFCGALTTFSTFALETLALAEHPARAAGHVVVSLVLWLAAAAAGLLVGRRLNAPGTNPHKDH